MPSLGIALAGRIAQILFEHWDPLEVGDAAPSDEYEEYARVIDAMLARGEGGSEVRAYLSRVRSDALLAPEDQARDEHVARAIVAARRD